MKEDKMCSFQPALWPSSAILIFSYYLCFSGFFIVSSWLLQIFTKYEKHRRLLLDDILASIARLPSSKRSLRSYRLNSEEHIQMLTALVLQLIQCVVVLPERLQTEASQTGATPSSANANTNTPPVGNKAVKEEPKENDEDNKDKLVNVRFLSYSVIS